MGCVDRSAPLDVRLAMRLPSPVAVLTPFKWLIAVRAARAPAGLERDAGRSAGPAGDRAAGGERSEPP